MLPFQKPFDSSHRGRNYSLGRIILQSSSQNVFYFISFGLLYAACNSVLFIIVGIAYLIPLLIRMAHQIRSKTAYVTTDIGHNLNNWIIKPLRMLILLVIAYVLQQPIWLLGFGIIFTKWALTFLYEKFFDVPAWYHLILVLLSSLLVLALYPFNLGIIQADTLKAFLTTIPTVYAAYVGLLGVFLSVTLAGGDKDMDLRRYFTGGIILDFLYTSALILLSLFGILVFGNEPLHMQSADLFSQTGYLSVQDVKRYVLFGIVFSLSWLLFFYTIMTAHLMLLETGKFIPAFWRKDGSSKHEEGSSPNQSLRSDPR